MLVLENVQASFSKGTIHQKKVIDNLSIDVKDGDFITVIGSNGAGKSSLLNAISGKIEIDAGNIYLDGKNINSKKEHNRATEIGRLFQDPLKGTAPNLTIEENLALAYFRGNKKHNFFTKLFAPAIKKQDRKIFKEYLKVLDLGLEDRLKMKVGLLSGGQRQALTLLMATINPPKLLLLDEHTAALDPKTESKVMRVTNKIIDEHKITTIMITHNIEQALKYGNRMIVLANGRVIFDFDKVKKEKMNIQDVLELYNKHHLESLSDSMIL